MRGSDGTADRTIREVAELSDALERAREAEARAMHELQRAREQTLAQLKERSDMLDVLAHEVRQPLNNARRRCRRPPSSSRATASSAPPSRCAAPRWCSTRCSRASATRSRWPRC